MSKHGSASDDMLLPPIKLALAKQLSSAHSMYGSKARAMLCVNQCSYPTWYGHFIGFLWCITLLQLACMVFGLDNTWLARIKHSHVGIWQHF